MWTVVWHERNPATSEASLDLTMESSNAGMDLYQVLGVPKNATAEIIKKARDEIAKQCHPDKARGDKDKEAQYAQAQDAYEILVITHYMLRPCDAVE